MDFYRRVDGFYGFSALRTHHLPGSRNPCSSRGLWGLGRGACCRYWRFSWSCVLTVNLESAGRKVP
jgi:hypothetical protein